MLSKLLIKTAVARIVNHEKFKNIKWKELNKKRAHKQRMIKRFGKARYYLAYWFGPWILYTGNVNFYKTQKKIYNISMKTYNINSIENYRKWEEWFRINGYKPWQYQHSYDAPEGFHVWFVKPGTEDIEIVTRSKAVHDAIMEYKK